MNTVKKGDAFENLCFQMISSALERKKFGLIPEYCTVSLRKGYYSNDRQSNIIFDISIEVWPPNADRFTLLYLIECKDYSTKPVPVDDVEEFYAKVTQVSGLNTKGIFITSNTFQKGAHTFARSKGIMLIEVNENITYNIVLHKANRYFQHQYESRMKNDGSPSIARIEAEFSKQKLQRRIEKEILSAFVNHVRLNLSKIQNQKIPILSSENIEEITVQLIHFFDSNIIQYHRNFPMDRFKQFLSGAFDLSIIEHDFLKPDAKERKIKSSCSFIDKCIRIDKSLRNTANYNFVLAHELGHFFLHNKLQIDQDAYEQLDDTEYNFILGRYVLQNERNWIEWQANQFAASLIMPQQPIILRLHKAQEKIGLKPGRPLYVDHQACNQNTFHRVTGELAFFFQTTKTNVIYRLNSFGLINESNDFRSLGQILAKILNVYTDN